MKLGSKDKAYTLYILLETHSSAQVLLVLCGFPIGVTSVHRQSHSALPVHAGAIATAHLYPPFVLVSVSLLEKKKLYLVNKYVLFVLGN